MANTLYTDTKKTLEAVQRLPVEAQWTILNMLQGAIAISDMYSMNKAWTTDGERSTVSRAAAGKIKFDHQEFYA